MMPALMPSNSLSVGMIMMVTLGITGCDGENRYYENAIQNAYELKLASRN